MNPIRTEPTRLRSCRTLLAAAVAATLLALPGLATAQAPAMVGSLGNFDVLNNTGQETHGFEIEMEGVQSADIYRIFGYWAVYGGNVIRYGAGTATDYPGGVRVRWTSPWDAVRQVFTQATPVPVNRTTVPGESCWIIGMPTTYYTAGCEHFGISAYRNPTRTTYRWLVADPQNPGSLIPSPVPISLPAPTWTVVPPAVAGNAPVVVAEIVAPPAPVQVVPPPVPQYGDAQWVKVYKTENAREVELEELVGRNAAVVPQAAAQLETEWDLIQHDPLQGQNRRGSHANRGDLGGGSRAVVRRYEYYEYAGLYDPVTHEALCGGDGTCSVPLDGEVGNAIGVQNVAANVAAPGIAVTKVGSGSVDSTDRVISCGSKCTAFYSMGAVVTLSTKPASGSVFSGWAGACSGTQSTCVVNVNDALTVTAKFAAAPGGGGGGGGGGGAATPGNPVLSVKVANGKGTITGNAGGINCGSVCSASVASGTVVTLNALPAAGFKFVNWTGACAGTAPACVLNVTASGTAQANFAK